MRQVNFGSVRNPFYRFEWPAIPEAGQWSTGHVQDGRGAKFWDWRRSIYINQLNFWWISDSWGFFLYDPCHVSLCLNLLGQSVSHSTPTWSSGNLGRGSFSCCWKSLGETQFPFQVLLSWNNFQAGGRLSSLQWWPWYPMPVAKDWSCWPHLDVPLEVWING